MLNVIEASDSDEQKATDARRSNMIICSVFWLMRPHNASNFCHDYSTCQWSVHHYCRLAAFFLFPASTGSLVKLEKVSDLIDDDLKALIYVDQHELFYLSRSTISII